MEYTSSLLSKGNNIYDIYILLSSKIANIKDNQYSFYIYKDTLINDTKGIYVNRPLSNVFELNINDFWAMPRNFKNATLINNRMYLRSHNPPTVEFTYSSALPFLPATPEHPYNIYNKITITMEILEIGRQNTIISTSERYSFIFTGEYDESSGMYHFIPLFSGIIFTNPINELSSFNVIFRYNSEVLDMGDVLQDVDIIATYSPNTTIMQNIAYNMGIYELVPTYIELAFRYRDHLLTSKNILSIISCNIDTSIIRLDEQLPERISINKIIEFITKKYVKLAPSDVYSTSDVFYINPSLIIANANSTLVDLGGSNVLLTPDPAIIDINKLSILPDKIVPIGKCNICILDKAVQIPMKVRGMSDKKTNPIVAT